MYRNKANILREAMLEKFGEDGDVKVTMLPSFEINGKFEVIFAFFFFLFVYLSHSLLSLSFLFILVTITNNDTEYFPLFFSFFHSVFHLITSSTLFFLHSPFSFFPFLSLSFFLLSSNYHHYFIVLPYLSLSYLFRSSKWMKTERK